MSWIFDDEHVATRDYSVFGVMILIFHRVVLNISTLVDEKMRSTVIIYYIMVMPVTTISVLL